MELASQEPHALVLPGTPKQPLSIPSWGSHGEEMPSSCTPHLNPLQAHPHPDSPGGSTMGLCRSTVQDFILLQAENWDTKLVSDQCNWVKEQKTFYLSLLQMIKCCLSKDTKSNTGHRSSQILSFVGTTLKERVLEAFAVSIMFSAHTS